MMEAIHEYLRACLGKTGMPLACIVRDDLAVPADPDPPAGCTSMQDEMTARTPILDPNDNWLPTAQADCLKVWEVISDLA